MSDQSNQPFGIPGGGPMGIPGAGPAGTGPSLHKTPPPIQPPHGGQTAGGDGSAFVLAGWGARFGAHILDIFVRALIVLPLPLLGFLLLADHPFSTYTVDPPDGISNLGGFFFAWLILYYLSGLFYAPIAMVNLNGATVGKKVAGIRVVTEAGQSPNFGEAFLREPIFKGIVVNMIGGAFVVGSLLDYLWPLWDEQSRAGHDFMAKTRVIQAA